MSSDIYERNIMHSICDLYQRSNTIINDFSACDSGTLNSMYTTFCMHMYGCELWNLSSAYIDKFKIAWRKVNAVLGNFLL